MKRLLMSAAMFLCCVATTFAQFSGSGSGTESDPYLIFNPIQLNQLRNFLGQSNVYFKLMNNIDLTEFLEDENPTQGWQPVGSSSSSFCGILDGNGKTISGLWINRSDENYVGFLGKISGAQIKNLNVEAISVSGNDYVNSFLNKCHCFKLSDCSFTGKIEGHSYIGGLFGKGEKRVQLSNLTGEVEVYGSGDYVGGIMGRFDVDGNGNSFITDCLLTNSVISGNNNVGGVCGYCDQSNCYSFDLEDCTIYAEIQGNNYVGGLCGYTYSTNHSRNHIRLCDYFGNISGNSYIGGLVGYCKLSEATASVI